MLKYHTAHLLPMEHINPSPNDQPVIIYEPALDQPVSNVPNTPNRIFYPTHLPGLYDHELKTVMGWNICVTSPFMNRIVNEIADLYKTGVKFKAQLHYFTKCGNYHTLYFKSRSTTAFEIFLASTIDLEPDCVELNISKAVSDGNCVIRYVNPDHNLRWTKSGIVSVSPYDEQFIERRDRDAWVTVNAVKAYFEEEDEWYWSQVD